MTDHTDLIKRLEAADKRPYGDGYFVCSDGQIWSTFKKRFLKPNKSQSGYAKIVLSINGRFRHLRVNRVVCEAFYGPPPEDNSHARHLNGIRDDNRAANLAWGSPSENAMDAVRHGTSSSVRNGKVGAKKIAGENNPSSKLTWPKVRMIRRLRLEGLTYPEIAEQFGVDQSNVSLICKNKTWKEPALKAKDQTK